MGQSSFVRSSEYRGERGAAARAFENKYRGGDREANERDGQDRAAKPRHAATTQPRHSPPPESLPRMIHDPS